MNIRMIEVDPRRIRLLERNAHFMRHETFQRLVANIKHDGAMTSVPFCAIYNYFSPDDEIPRHEDTGEPIYEVLSGNHRIKAAVAAGLETVYVMATDDPLSKEKRVAIQLSHNAIFGEDDPAVLRQLYEEVSDVNLRVYSGLDDKTLELLKEVNVSSLSEANLDFQIITFAFLPHEIDAVKEVWDDVKLLFQGDELWLARWAEYDKFLDSLEDAASSYGVSNAATTLMVLLEIVSRHISDLSDGWYDDGAAIKGKDWVPLSTAVGSGKMPAESAALVKRAVDLMVSRGDVDPARPWLALERMAFNYVNNR